MAEQPYNIDDIFERLSGDARTNPIPEYVMDVTTTEGLEDARLLVEHAVNQKWTTGADLARRTGIKPTVISEFRTRKWKKFKAGTLATTASTLARVINQIVREQEAAKTEISGYVEIRVAEEINAIVQYAIKRKRIVAFLVNAGCGKTLCMQALRLDTPGAIMVTVKLTRGHVKSYLQLWARALGLSESGRAEDIQDRVTNQLSGTSRLVLVDEVHKLSVAGLDATREIWDEARIPVVLAGTPTLYQTVFNQRVGSRAVEIMDQFSSRCAIFRDLTHLENPDTGHTEPKVTVADIRKLYARGRVRLARDGVDFLFRLANTPGAGGLRICSDLVQMVIDLYPDATVTAALLTQALGMRRGAKEAGFAIEQLETPEPQTAAAGG